MFFLKFLLEKKPLAVERDWWNSSFIEEKIRFGGNKLVDEIAEDSCAKFFEDSFLKKNIKILKNFKKKKRGNPKPRELF